jgi:hypothetical protein
MSVLLNTLRDNELETKYETTPNRVYIVDTLTMQITYASNPGPFNPAGKIKDGVTALQNQLQAQVLKLPPSNKAEHVD